MNLISFYELFLKIIRFQHPDEMVAINHYYLDNKQLFFNDQEKYTIEKNPIHLTILNILGLITTLASHKNVLIIYKGFPYEDGGREISFAQFWDESRLLYQGGGTTTKLENDPTLFFTANILDDVYAKASNTFMNHAIHTNNLIKRIENIKDRLLEIYQQIPVLSLKELNRHTRELYPEISDNEAYVIFRIFKKDEYSEEENAPS